MPVSLVIGEAGGKIFASDGTSVEIPPGALSASTTITITPDPTAPAPAPGVWVGTPFDFGPEGTQFAKPVTVTMTFSPSLVPKKDPEVVIETAPAGSTSYTSLGGTLTDATHVSAPTSHFSIFGPAAEPPAGGTTTGGSPGTTGTASGGTGTGGATSTGTGTGTAGTTGTSSGSGGSSSSTGGTSTGSSLTCPSSGAMGCGTLTIFPPAQYDDFVWDTATSITIGELPGLPPTDPVVPAIVFGDPAGLAKGYTIWVGIPTCPTAPGTVMESSVLLDNPNNTTGKQFPFTATVDFLTTDGGIAGTIQGQAGTAEAGFSATFAFPASLGAGDLCTAPPLDLPVFGPASFCSAELDAGCSASTTCALLPDGGQPTAVGSLMVDNGESTCVSTYAPIPVTVTLGQSMPGMPFSINATGPDGGWDISFDLACCPAGLGTLPATADFSVDGCGKQQIPSPFAGLLTVESLDGGLAGNLYANGAALYFSFDPSFTTPLDAGPAGSLYGSCYPCQSSGDDGGTAAACAGNGDCCESNCAIDAGVVGVCE